MSDQTNIYTVADSMQDDFYTLTLGEVVNMVAEEYKATGSKEPVPVGCCTHAGFNFFSYDRLPPFLAALKEKIPVSSFELTILDTNRIASGNKYYFPTTVVAKTRKGEMIYESVPDLRVHGLNIIYTTQIPLVDLEKMEMAYSNLYSELKKRQDWLTTDEYKAKLTQAIKNSDVFGVNEEYDPEVKREIEEETTRLINLTSKLASQQEKETYIKKIEREEKMVIGILRRAYDEVKRSERQSLGDLQAAMVGMVIEQKLAPFNIPLNKTWRHIEEIGEIETHTQVDHAGHIVEWCPFFASIDHINFHLKGFKAARKDWTGKPIPRYAVAAEKLKVF